MKTVLSSSCTIGLLLMLAMMPGSGFPQSSAPIGVLGLWYTNSFPPPSGEFSINVGPDKIAINNCAPVRYIVIRNQDGHGPTVLPATSSAWHETALELKPATKKQARCLPYRVLDFSIPDDMHEHADLALFTNRYDFDHEQHYAWVGLGLFERPGK